MGRAPQGPLRTGTGGLCCPVVQSAEVWRVSIAHAPGSRAMQRVDVHVKGHQLRAAAVTLPHLPAPQDLATVGNTEKNKGSRSNR